MYYKLFTGQKKIPHLPNYFSWVLNKSGLYVTSSTWTADRHVERKGNGVEGALGMLSKKKEKKAVNRLLFWGRHWKVSVMEWSGTRMLKSWLKPDVLELLWLRWHLLFVDRRYACWDGTFPHLFRSFSQLWCGAHDNGCESFNKRTQKQTWMHSHSSTTHSFGAVLMHFQASTGWQAFPHWNR